MEKPEQKNMPHREWSFHERAGEAFPEKSDWPLFLINFISAFVFVVVCVFTLFSPFISPMYFYFVSLVFGGSWVATYGVSSYLFKRTQKYLWPCVLAVMPLVCYSVFLLVPVLLREG